MYLWSNSPRAAVIYYLCSYILPLRVSSSEAIEHVTYSVTNYVHGRGNLTGLAYLTLSCIHTLAETSCVGSKVDSNWVF